MIPTWEIAPLGEVCDFQRGLSYAKTDEIDVSDNVVLRATNIDLETNLLNLTKLKYINDKVAVAPGKKIKKGSLLICTASRSKSHLGKVAYIDADYDYAFGGFMGMITPKNGLVSKFLFHLMTSYTYKDFISELSDGTNINNLKFDDLKNFQVPHPNRHEQQRIVGILDEAFDGIATAKANAEKNLHNARVLFESHLQGVFTELCEKSKQRPLFSLCSLFGDSEHRTPKYQQEGIPALRPRDVVDGKLLLSGAARVSKEEYDIQTKRHKPSPGDIVYSRELSYGWAVALPELPRVCLSQGMCIFRTAADVDTAFLLYVLNGPVGRAQAVRAAVGAAHPHINLSDIKSYLIPVPPLDEQRRLTRQFDAAAADSQRLESIYQKKLAALAALKESLLHEAFTGAL